MGGTFEHQFFFTDETQQTLISEEFSLEEFW